MAIAAVRREHEPGWHAGHRPRRDPVPVVRGETVDMGGLDLTVELRGFSEYTLLIAKRDPGQPIVWAAFVTLLAGLAVTFYLPRRRVWARLGADGRLDLVGRSDRQVDFDREFGGLVDALVTARGAAPVAGAARSVPGVTDLAALAAELLPGAAWVAGERPGRPIAWVRVLRARVPAFDALEPGDLVDRCPRRRSPSSRPGRRSCASSSTALAAVPVSGVLLVDVEADAGAAPAGDVPTRGGGLAGLASAPRGPIPALRLGRTDPSSSSGASSGSSSPAARSWSARRRSSRRSFGVGPGGRGRRGAGRRRVGLPRPRARARGGPREARSSSTRRRRRPAPRRTRRATRRRPPTAPSRFGSRCPRPRGPARALVVLGAEPVGELARVALPRVAGLLALELAREEAVRGATRPRAASRADAVGRAAVGRPPGAPAGARRRRRLRRGPRAVARRPCAGQSGSSRRLGAWPFAATPTASSSASWRPAAPRTFSDSPSRSAAGSAGPLRSRARSPPPADRPGAEAEARATLEAALALDDPPRLARADRLAVYRMLGALHRLPDGAAPGASRPRAAARRPARRSS